MKTYQEMSKEELTQELTALKAEYEKIKGMGLALDMSRGKPSQAQLDLSMGMTAGVQTSRCSTILSTHGSSRPLQYVRE